MTLASLNAKWTIHRRTNPAIVTHY